MTDVARVSAEGVSLAPPPGWLVSQGATGTTCVAPAAALADVTGRLFAPEITISATGRSRWAPVPAGAAGSGGGGIEAVAQEIVDGTFAGDPQAWLLDAKRIRFDAADPDSAFGIRLVVAYRDRSTAMVSETVVIPVAGRFVAVTALVPVAQHAEHGTRIDQALMSARTDEPQTAAAWEDLIGSDVDHLVAGRSFVSPPGTLSGDDELIFRNASRQVAKPHRPPLLRHGLIDGRGVTTELGHEVRKALHQPDPYLRLTVCVPGSAELSNGIVMLRQGACAVLFSHRAPWHEGGQVMGAAPGFEVVDVAAVPARMAAWAGLGSIGFSADEGEPHLHLTGGWGTPPAGPQVCEATSRWDTTEPLQAWQQLLRLVVGDLG